MTYYSIGKYQIFTLQLLYSCQTVNGAKRKKDNSPSKPKDMPKDYIPVHFLSWLTYGPASDNPNPLWIPDTGKSIVKEKANILDMKVEGSNNGKMSSFSRKARYIGEVVNNRSKKVDDRMYEIVKTTATVKSVVSYQVLNGLTSMVSASHCQEGQGGYLFKILKIKNAGKIVSDTIKRVATMKRSKRGGRKTRKKQKKF